MQGRTQQDGEDWDQHLSRVEKEQCTGQIQLKRNIILIVFYSQLLPAWRPDPQVQKTRHSASKSLLLGPRVALSSGPGSRVPLMCPLVCFFAGKRGSGRDHVLPVLPANSRPAHPHSDQMSEPQGNGHHRLLRYLFSPSGLPIDISSSCHFPAKERE